METDMWDRTTSRSSSSISPTSRTAARKGPAEVARLARRVAVVSLAVAALPAAAIPSSTPARAADPCAPLAAGAVLTAPQSGDVYLRSGAAACDRIAIEVVGRGLEGVFTLGFDVRFPADRLAYDGHTAGAFLEQGTPRMPPLYLVRSTGPGSIAVSMTRFAPDPAVGADADAVIVTLRFRKAGSGSGAIDFDASPASDAAERILGADGSTRPARFGPGHGVTLTIP
jgi:hypothetical protein